jgi:hypothetical protein
MPELPWCQLGADQDGSKLNLMENSKTEWGTALLGRNPR